MLFGKMVPTPYAMHLSMYLLDAWQTLPSQDIYATVKLLCESAPFFCNSDLEHILDWLQLVRTLNSSNDPSLSHHWLAVILIELVKEAIKTISIELNKKETFGISTVWSEEYEVKAEDARTKSSSRFDGASFRSSTPQVALTCGLCRDIRNRTAWTCVGEPASSVFTCPECMLEWSIPFDQLSLEKFRSLFQASKISYCGHWNLRKVRGKLMPLRIFMLDECCFEADNRKLFIQEQLIKARFLCISESQLKTIIPDFRRSDVRFAFDQRSRQVSWNAPAFRVSVGDMVSAFMSRAGSSVPYSIENDFKYFFDGSIDDPLISLRFSRTGSLKSSSFVVVRRFLDMFLRSNPQWSNRFAEYEAALRAMTDPSYAKQFAEKHCDAVYIHKGDKGVLFTLGRMYKSVIVCAGQVQRMQQELVGSGRDEAFEEQRARIKRILDIDDKQFEALKSGDVRIERDNGKMWNEYARWKYRTTNNELTSIASSRFKIGPNEAHAQIFEDFPAVKELISFQRCLLSMLQWYIGWKFPDFQALRHMPERFGFDGAWLGTDDFGQYWKDMLVWPHNDRSQLVCPHVPWYWVAYAVTKPCEMKDQILCNAFEMRCEVKAADDVPESGGHITLQSFDVYFMLELGVHGGPKHCIHGPKHFFKSGSLVTVHRPWLKNIVWTSDVSVSSL